MEPIPSFGCRLTEPFANYLRREPLVDRAGFAPDCSSALTPQQMADAWARESERCFGACTSP